MNDLRLTVTNMVSGDYKERFIAEYWQTKIRYDRLKKFVAKLEAADISRFGSKPYEEPKHDCPLKLLQDQLDVMGKYLHILEIRTVLENIDLEVQH